MIKGVYKFVGFGIIFLIFLMMVMNQLQSHPSNQVIEVSSDIPCQNLDALDSVKEILHWEIINDTLHVYTKEDSIRDEIERWRYIDSIYKADERAYDKWMESQ
tara:strand:+ start:260 stop:568 length:309 start_codon:yes stop_codon:yes gene_type:complete